MFKTAVKSFLKELSDIYFKGRLPRSAAALAYNLTLSVFPLLLCLGVLFGSYGGLAEVLREVMSGFFPESDVELLTGYLYLGTGSAGKAVFAAGAIMLLTSSSAAFRTLENTMADIFGTYAEPGIGRILLSFLWSVLFFLGVYVSCAIILSGSFFTSALSEALGIEALRKSWFIMRFPVLFLLMYFLILGTYFVTVPKCARGVKRGTGAFCAAAALVIVSAVFSWGVGQTQRYDIVYGSIASVIILMIWFYISSLIVVTGGALNAVIGKRIKY